MNSYLDVWKKFGDFSGRARRREYWMFTLVSTIVSLGLLLIDVFAGFINKEIGISLLYGIYTLAVFIPAIAVTSRRLHDTNHSGWTILLMLIPLIGPIILFVWMVRDSDPGKNMYGSNPKQVLYGFGD
jgi:uncharacterized membrane protein YhaH (DUF805 family)